MPVTKLQGSLQRLVVTPGRRFELIYVNERRKRDRTRRRVYLVEIAITKQLAARRTDVANFDRDISRQFLLKIRTVDMNVRRADLLIDGKNIRGRKGRSVKHTHPGRQRCRR